MITAAAYIRVSTEDQVEFSPDSQLKEIRKYAKAHDMILPEEFVYLDEGISGRKADKRPAFQKMIGTAKVKPRPFDVILLWKFSRFARNREDSIVYKSMLRKQCGIDVVSISEPLGEDKTSVLLEAVIEAMDEFYSLNLSEEVKRGMTEKFSRGGVVSQPPFGYKMGDDVFLKDETTAPIIQMIFKDYLNGQGYRQIANKLNDMGITTKSGHVFENRTVEYIISNPAYIGKFRRRKDPKDKSSHFLDKDVIYVDGKHEAIIDKDMFDKAQEKRLSLKRMYPKHSRTQPAEFMLKGLVRCDSCGATLCLSGSKKYIQCHRYAHGTCKVSHCISLEKINKIVLEKIKADLKDATFDINLESEKAKTESVLPIDALIQKENLKLSRVKEAYEAGIDTIEEYRENKAKIKARIDELNLHREKEAPSNNQDRKRELKGIVQSGLKILESPTASESVKNATLRGFVDKIIYYKPKNIIEIIYKV